MQSIKPLKDNIQYTVHQTQLNTDKKSTVKSQLSAQLGRAAKFVPTLCITSLTNDLLNNRETLISKSGCWGAQLK